MRDRLVSAGALLAVAMLVGTPASAQQARTFVSGLGDDASATCSQTAPCKTFAGAIAKTAGGGEIHCLDSGGYGNVNITIPVLIDCSGATGGITVAGLNAVVVNTGGPVVLKGLDLNGLQSVGNGVKILQGTVTIDHCLITNFGGGPASNGIFVNNTAGVSLTVSHCLIVNNTGAAIWVKPFSGASDVEVAFEDVHAAHNGFGLVFDGTGGGTGRIYGTVSDSALDDTAHNGVTVSNTNASNISIKLENVQVTGGVWGLVASGTNAGMIVGGARITGNTTGLSATNGGLLYSYGDNRVNGNATDGAFSATIQRR